MGAAGRDEARQPARHRRALAGEDVLLGPYALGRQVVVALEIGIELSLGGARVVVYRHRHIGRALDLRRVAPGVLGMIQQRLPRGASRRNSWRSA